MGGTIEGGRKAALKNKQRDPDFYTKVGKLGGAAKVPKGFAKMSPEKRSEAGRLGGKNSWNARRTAVVEEQVKKKRRWF